MVVLVAFLLALAWLGFLFGSFALAEWIKQRRDRENTNLDRHRRHRRR